MDRLTIQKTKIPDTPGVYFFLGDRKKILYIGKATSLKNRISSYFSDDLVDKRSFLIEKMVREAKKVEFTSTDSVLEALILETNLIRIHKPFYNTKSKDDKSYNHIVITNEEFPRLLIVRAKDLAEQFDENIIKYEFGPYPSGQLFKDALKIIRKLFQFYDMPVPVGEEKSSFAKGKINFNQQIGLYPYSVTKSEYNRTIRHLRLFFEGKKKQVVRELETEMHKLANIEEFEKANRLKNKIFALNHIQDISLLKDESRIYRDENKIRIEAYDVAHMQGEEMVGVMTVIEGGEAIKSDYRKFKINSFTKANDPGALSEMLIRRLNHKEWQLPQLIVVDGSTIQKNVAEKVLCEAILTIPVVAVVKNELHKPVRLIGPKSLITKHKLSILLGNAEAHRFAVQYHRKKLGKRFIRKSREK